MAANIGLVMCHFRIYGRTVICDKDDLDVLQNKKWTVSLDGALVTKNGKFGTQRIGRFIFSIHNKIPTGVVVAYKNKNKHDVRKENLFLQTYTEKNRGKRKTTKLRKCKGYYLNKGGWQVLITVNGKLRYFGTFRNNEEAKKKAKEVLEKRKCQ